MSTVEFHPWHSRRADTEHPDELRIDLDPQPGAGLDEAKQVAAIVHETLDELGAVGWPKTSGSRGIHVYVRIEPRFGFREVRRAALAFAREIERRAPELVTTAWWKEERTRAIFVDYNQNARDRTIASGLFSSGQAVGTGVSAGDLGRATRRGDERFHHRDDAGAFRRSSAICTTASTRRCGRSSRCWSGPIETSGTAASAMLRIRRTSRSRRASRRAFNPLG